MNTACRCRASPTAEVLDRLLRGVPLDDGAARFDGISIERRDDDGATVRVVLHEGRNREVRRLWSAVGHEVTKLARIRYGPVALPRDLPAGSWRDLPASLAQGL